MLLMAQDRKLIHLGSIPFIKWEYHHVPHRSEGRFQHISICKTFLDPKIKYFSKTEITVRVLLYFAKYFMDQNKVQ